MCKDARVATETFPVEAKLDMESERNQHKGDRLVVGRLQSLHSSNYSFLHLKTYQKTTMCKTLSKCCARL